MWVTSQGTYSIAGLVPKSRLVRRRPRTRLRSRVLLRTHVLSHLCTHLATNERVCLAPYLPAHAHSNRDNHSGALGYECLPGNRPFCFGPTFLLSAPPRALPRGVLGLRRRLRWRLSRWARVFSNWDPLQNCSAANQNPGGTYKVAPLAGCGGNFVRQDREGTYKVGLLAGRNGNFVGKDHEGILQSCSPAGPLYFKARGTYKVALLAGRGGNLASQEPGVPTTLVCWCRHRD